MKVAKILIEDIGEPDGDGERLLMGVRCVRGLAYDPSAEVYIAADRVISVEDYLEPLPTTRGTVFKGRLGDVDEVLTWMVTVDHRGQVSYRCEDGRVVPEQYSKELEVVSQ